MPSQQYYVGDVPMAPKMQGDLEIDLHQFPDEIIEALLAGKIRSLQIDLGQVLFEEATLETAPGAMTRVKIPVFTYDNIQIKEDQ